MPPIGTPGRKRFGEYDRISVESTVMKAHDRFGAEKLRFYCCDSGRSSFYLFIKQFHKNMTADNTRTVPTRLAKHSQWPQ